MRKFVILFLALLTPLFIVVPVFAKETGEHIILDANEIIDKDYFAGGEAVTILGTVNGDAYVAGGNVTIEGTVNGDLLVAGGNIVVRGTVTDDIRAAGGSLTLSGNVGKNVTAVGGNVTISEGSNVMGSVVMAGGNLNLNAPVGRGATLAGGQVSVASEIGGDVWAGVGALTVTSNARINGDLHYISEDDATILSGATISGETRRDQPPADSQRAQETGKAVATGIVTGFKFASLLSSLLIGFLLIRLLPQFMQSTAEKIKNDPWKALGFGFLTYIISPVAVLLLIITLVGIPLALILLFATFLLAYIAKIFVAVFVGNWIMKKANWKGGLFVALFLGLVVYYGLGMIPVINAFSTLLFLLMGTGALLLTKKEYYSKLRSRNSI